MVDEQNIKEPITNNNPICKYCNKTIQLPPNYRTTNKRVFCNSTCRTKHYYHTNPKYKQGIIDRQNKWRLTHKDDPAYKKKLYERTKKWVETHRERFNELMRLRYARSQFTKKMLKQQQKNKEGIPDGFI